MNNLRNFALCAFTLCSLLASRNAVAAVVPEAAVLVAVPGEPGQFMKVSAGELNNFWLSDQPYRVIRIKTVRPSFEEKVLGLREFRPMLDSKQFFKPGTPENPYTNEPIIDLQVYDLTKPAEIAPAPDGNYTHDQLEHAVALFNEHATAHFRGLLTPVECPICFERIKAGEGITFGPEKYDCAAIHANEPGHLFHMECVQGQPRCPLCRATHEDAAAARAQEGAHLQEYAALHDEQEARRIAQEQEGAVDAAVPAVARAEPDHGFWQQADFRNAVLAPAPFALPEPVAAARDADADISMRMEHDIRFWPAEFREQITQYLGVPEGTLIRFLGFYRGVGIGPGMVGGVEFAVAGHGIRRMPFAADDPEQAIAEVAAIVPAATQEHFPPLPRRWYVLRPLLRQARSVLELRQRAADDEAIRLAHDEHAMGVAPVVAPAMPAAPAPQPALEPAAAAPAAAPMVPPAADAPQPALPPHMPAGRALVLPPAQQGARVWRPLLYIAPDDPLAPFARPAAEEPAVHVDAAGRLDLSNSAIEEIKSGFFNDSVRELDLSNSRARWVFPFFDAIAPNLVRIIVTGSPLAHDGLFARIVREANETRMRRGGPRIEVVGLEAAPAVPPGRA